MTDVLFLWFGVVAIVFAIDLYHRDSPLFPVPGIMGLMSLGAYIGSIFVTPP